ncbi:hypothetical protein ABK040_010437 [Willaertia magna]
MSEIKSPKNEISSGKEEEMMNELQFQKNNFLGFFNYKFEKDVLTVEVKEAATGRCWRRSISKSDAIEISKQGNKLSIGNISKLIVSSLNGEENINYDLYFTPESYPLSTSSDEMKDLKTELNEVNSDKCNAIITVTYETTFLTIQFSISLEEIDRSEKVIVEELLRKNFYLSQVVEKLELKNTLLEHKYLLQSKQISELEARITELTQMFVQTLRLQQLKLGLEEALINEQVQQQNQGAQVELVADDDIDVFNTESAYPNCIISEDRKTVKAKESEWGSTVRLAHPASIHNNYIEFQIVQASLDFVMFFGVITSSCDEQMKSEGNVIGSSQLSPSFALSLTDGKLYNNGKHLDQTKIEWAVGDKVGLLVDFKQESLKFYKNGKLIIDGFKGLISNDKKWHFALSLCKENDTVSVVPKIEV